MALPASRERNYAPGAQVISADLNKIQDCIVNASRKAFSRTFLPRFVGLSGGTFDVVGNPANVNFPLVQKSSASLFAFYYVRFEDGDQITGVSFEGYGDGAVDAVVEMSYAPDAHTAVSALGTLTITNTPATWTPYSIPSFTSQLLVAGAALIGAFKPNAANFYVGPVTIGFIRP